MERRSYLQIGLNKISNEQFKNCNFLSTILSTHNDNIRSKEIFPKISTRFSNLNIDKKSSFSSITNLPTNRRSLKDSTNLLNEELMVKTYLKTKKKTMIISKYLDDDTRKRFEELKYSKTKPVFEDPCQTEDNFLNDSFFNKQPSNDPGILNDKSSGEFNDNHLVNTSFMQPCSSLLKRGKEIRFGSTLSKDAQFALIKTLEDTIVQEMSVVYPEFKSQIPRTSTALFLKRKLKSPFYNSASNSIFTDSLISHNSSESNLSYGNKDKILKEYYSNQSSKEDFSYQLPTIKTIQINEINDIEKKIITTNQIQSAMEILDTLRSKPKKVNKIERIKFSSPKISAKPKALAPMINETQSNINAETLNKYSEWNNYWKSQLENI